MNHKLLLILIATTLTFGCSTKDNTPRVSNLPHHTGKFTITGAYALYPLASLWTTEYSRLHPEIQFDLTATGTGKGFEDVLSGKADLAMISNEIPYEADKVLWNSPVARLAVVPVINSKNPCLEDIRKRGLKHDELTSLFSGNGPKTWGELCGCKNTQPIHIYIRGDKAGASAIWQNWLLLDSAEMNGNRIAGEDNMMAKVKEDPLAISYCNFIFACDAKDKKILDELAVVPLDVNRNGKIDERENFYMDYTELQRAMWSEKYPHALLRDLYFVTKGKPNSVEMVEFLKWILTEGQKMIPDAGYIELHSSEIRCRMNFLTNIDTAVPAK